MIELTEEFKKKLDTYEKVQISRKDFDALPEYSLSTPTQSANHGVKKWKHRTPPYEDEDAAIWFLGEIKENMCVYSHITEITD